MRRWQILLVLGIAGLASLLVLPFERIVPLALPAPVVRLLSLIQPAVLTLVAVFAGEAAARRTGLGAPLIDAWLTRGDLSAILRRQLRPALLAGATTALVLLAYALTVGRALDQGNRLTAFDVPLVAKLLYGGLTEEVLTRWGLASVLA